MGSSDSFRWLQMASSYISLPRLTILDLKLMQANSDRPYRWITSGRQSSLPPPHLLPLTNTYDQPLQLWALALTLALAAHSIQHTVHLFIHHIPAEIKFILDSTPLCLASASSFSPIPSSHHPINFTPPREHELFRLGQLFNPEPSPRLAQD